MWKQNIGQEQLIDRGYIMCCSIKELGSSTVHYLENRTEDDEEITKEIIDWLDRADYVITHNGKKFDIPFIKARAVVHSITPPSPFKEIDTLEIAKKEFKFTRNTLANLCEELNVTNKKSSHPAFNGFILWAECMKRNDKAWKEMKKYNELDVISLEQVYLKIRAWYSQHPNINVNDDIEQFRCPKCGSTHLHKRGYYTTNTGKYQKYHCQECGGYSSGRYTENTLSKRKSLLKAI
jgi:DNA polymerase III epsilon subunit-like protein